MDEKKQRKVKFTPKAQPRKKRQTTALKHEEEEDGKTADEEAELLLHRFNENIMRQGTRAERKPAAAAAVQVAFDQSAAAVSSIPIQTYEGVSKDGRSGGSSSGIRQLKSLEPEDKEDGVAYAGDGILPPYKMEKHYREPWDYHHSYYPTTLPLRMPYAGDPAILDDEEFGEAVRNVEYDESTINPATELGLMQEGEEKEKMMLFQLPPSLPLKVTSAKGKEKRIGRSLEEEGCKLKELNKGGFLGKLMIYKSGMVKLKLGDTLYDVSPGSDSVFAENAAAINTEDRHCCVLGEVGKRAIVTPDIDSLLS